MEIEGKCNGNGMECNENGMEWAWNGNGMGMELE